MDTIFSPEEIREIQTDELSAIENMTLEEIQNRIDTFQRKSRELYLRMQKSSAKLHERLAAVNDEELSKMVQKIPMASIEANNRRVLANSTKRISKSEKLQRGVEKLSRQNPMIADFLNSLKKKD